MEKDNIFVADFETTTINTKYYQKHNDVCVNMFHVENLTFTKSYTGVHIKEMIKWLWNLKRKQTYVYFHNLSFDGDFLLKWIARNGYKPYNHFFNSENVLKSGKWFTYLRQNQNIYSITIFKGNRLIEFRCSLKILSAGVKALGKSIQIDKYKNVKNVMDFYDVEPQFLLNQYDKNYVEYCKRDVEIVIKSLNMFIDNLNHINKEKGYKPFDITQFLTAGAIAYHYQEKIVRGINYDWYLGFKISDKSYQIAKNFYFGGFTQFNPSIQYKETILDDLEKLASLKIDINSAHPFSMTQLLPYGEIFDMDEIQPEQDAIYLKYYELQIENATIKKGMEHLVCLFNWRKLKKGLSIAGDIFYNTRYSQILNDFRCYYFEKEWDILNQIYDFKGVKIIKTYWCYANYVLCDFVNLFYGYKSDYSKLGDKARANTFKIILNSAYGKHGSRQSFDDTISVDKNVYDEWICKELTITHKSGEKTYMCLPNTNNDIELENSMIMKLERIGIIDNNKHKLIAATITSYSRIYLIDSILKSGVENFLYCDTDSIYLSNGDKARTHLKFDDYELGAWKIEKENFKRFYTHGAKKLRIVNNDDSVETTFSGVHQSKMKDIPNDVFMSDDEIILPDGRLKKIHCKSGIALSFQDMKVKRQYF